MLSADRLKVQPCTLFAQEELEEEGQSTPSPSPAARALAAHVTFS